jgi:hypothetical protein
MCSNPATSDEHVPPRCLFPEKKDLPAGVDLRKQLITVPSCDAHNTAKSHDDEYLLYLLLLNIPNNETAKNHFFTKVQRAIQRNPSLIQKFAEKRLPVVAEDTVTGEMHQTIAVQIDEARLHDSLEHIGRSLYFHEHGKPWEGEVSAYPHFLLNVTQPNAAELNEPNERMQKAVELMMQGNVMKGENPEVFCYQITEGTPPVSLVMYLRIYEGSRITLLFRNHKTPLKRPKTLKRLGVTSNIPTCWNVRRDPAF